MNTAEVSVGDSIKQGQIIGTVGKTGAATEPHLHWQIDRGVAGETYHVVYSPSSMLSREEAAKHVINPIYFTKL